MVNLLYLHFTQREALAAFIGAMTGVKRQKIVKKQTKSTKDKYICFKSAKKQQQKKTDADLMKQ